jgi:hypothetical protein
VHSHRDDRVATVASGTWYFGYGDRFDAKSLKKLPPGSVYSEPGAHNHFARTDKDAVIVQNLGVWSDRHSLFQSSRRTETGKVRLFQTPHRIVRNLHKH